MKRRSLLGAFAAAPLLAQEETGRRPRGMPPLKITDVKAVNAEGYIFYRVYTDGGVTGVGEPSPSNGPLNVTFVEMLKPLITGMDAFNIEAVWQKMYVGLYKTRGQSASMAISAVDVALHDIVGKALGVPACVLLGGMVREKIPMYASFTSRERSPLETAELCAKSIEAGFEGVKIKIAARHGYDAAPKFPDDEMVREVRAAIGPKAKLGVDANSGYTVPTAIRIGRMLAEYNVDAFEEPVPFTDYAGTARVRASIDIPIQGGEQDHTRYDFQKMIAAEAVDIVQADVTKAGGLSECKKISTIADAWGLSHTPHDTSHALGLAACLHLVAATPCCRYLQEYVTEPGSLRRRPIIAEPLTPVRGSLTVPSKPGLGVELLKQWAE